MTDYPTLRSIDVCPLCARSKPVGEIVCEKCVRLVPFSQGILAAGEAFHSRDITVQELREVA